MITGVIESGVAGNRGSLTAASSCQLAILGGFAPMLDTDHA
jgi:hypothetical protein